MNTRTVIATFAAALAVLALASAFRFELVARNESAGAYRIDRWTGAVELIRGTESEAVTGEDAKPLGLVGALTPAKPEESEREKLAKIIEEMDTHMARVEQKGEPDAADVAELQKINEAATAQIARIEKEDAALITKKEIAVKGVIGAAIGAIFAAYFVISALISRLRKRRVAVAAVESKQ